MAAAAAAGAGAGVKVGVGVGVVVDGGSVGASLDDEDEIADEDLMASSLGSDMDDIAVTAGGQLDPFVDATSSKGEELDESLFVDDDATDNEDNMSYEPKGTNYGEDDDEGLFSAFE